MSTAVPITADPPRRRGGGPKTEAAKRRASMNAVRHGMYSAAVVLPGESQQEYDALLARYLDRFRPTSPDQEHLVHTLANADWRIKRLVHIQTAKLAERIERQPDEGRDPVTQAYSFEVRHSEALLTADKHEARLQRDYDRALRRLLEIEKRRAQTKNQRNELESVLSDTSPEPPAVSTEASETANASACATQPASQAPQPAATFNSGPPWAYTSARTGAIVGLGITAESPDKRPPRGRA
jgi:hypothetical protein